MERNSTIDEACGSITSIKSEKINVVEHCNVDEIIEESWFFGNLLLNQKPKEKTTIKTHITRCYSDPCICHCSSTIVGDQRKSNCGELLTRTQLLPQFLRNFEVENHQGRDLKMTKLPPKHDKGISRYITPRKTEFESINGSNDLNMMRRYINGRNLRRSTSELEIEEVQGFKDLGFRFDNKDSLSPRMVNILPGLKEMGGEDLGLKSNVKRPYLSEAWLVQSHPPNWASTRSSQDMKAQIKFWAKSVAANVRLES